MEAMQSRLASFLAHLDPADAASRTIARDRLDTMLREFESRRIAAEEARRRMRAYVDQRAEPAPEETREGLTEARTAAVKSTDYARDAILAAIAAFEEAELATLEAILIKWEADLCSASGMR